MKVKELEEGSRSETQLRGIPELNSSMIRQEIIPIRTRKPISHICYLLAIAAMVMGPCSFNVANVFSATA